MKVVVDIFTDTIKSVYKEDDVTDTRKGCYCVSLPLSKEPTKFVKKGVWTNLKDEKGDQILGSDLKPTMGYEVTENDVKVKLTTHTSFWTLKELIEAKYQDKLKSEAAEYSAIYFEEFVDDASANFEGSLSFGKKVCFGQGILIHKLNVTNNKIFFNCEYTGTLPKIDISLDGETFTRIKELPFRQDFRKTEYKQVCIKINDSKNHLTAYWIGFNQSTGQDNKEDDIGRGFVVQ